MHSYGRGVKKELFISVRKKIHQAEQRGQPGFSQRKMDLLGSEFLISPAWPEAEAGRWHQAHVLAGSCRASAVPQQGKMWPEHHSQGLGGGEEPMRSVRREPKGTWFCHQSNNKPGSSVMSHLRGPQGFLSSASGWRSLEWDESNLLSTLSAPRSESALMSAEKPRPSPELLKKQRKSLLPSSGF